MNKYEFQFEIGDRVKIIDLDIKGRVNAIYLDNGGQTYRVKYFYNGERKEVYFEGDEITKIDNKEPNTLLFSKIKNEK